MAEGDEPSAELRVDDSRCADAGSRKPNPAQEIQAEPGNPVQNPEIRIWHASGTSPGFLVLFRRPTFLSEIPRALVEGDRRAYSGTPCKSASATMWVLPALQFAAKCAGGKYSK